MSRSLKSQLESPSNSRRTHRISSAASLDPSRAAALRNNRMDLCWSHTRNPITSVHLLRLAVSADCLFLCVNWDTFWILFQLWRLPWSIACDCTPWRQFLTNLGRFASSRWTYRKAETNLRPYAAFQEEGGEGRGKGRVSMFVGLLRLLLQIRKTAKKGKSSFWANYYLVLREFWNENNTEDCVEFP